MLKKLFKQYVTENKYEVSVILLLLFVGIICGIIMFFLISPSAKDSLILSVKTTLDLSKQEGFAKLDIVSNAIKIDILVVGIMCFISITLIARCGMYVLSLVKGVSIGIYACIIFCVFNFWWACLVTFLMIILVNIVYIPAFVYIAISLLTFNFDLFKTKLNLGVLGISKLFAKILIAFVIMFSSSILEQVFSSIMLNIYAKI